MPRWMKHVFGIFGVLTVAACSGSTSCSSCGMTPLPAGFPKADRIENAASARITDSGFTFIQNNIGGLASNLLSGQGGTQGGLMTFSVPESTTSGTGYDITICPGGPDAAAMKCVAEIDIGHAAMTITSGAPHEILAFGPVPLRLKNLPITGTALGFIPIDVSAVASGGGNNDCDPNTMSFKNVDVNADISIEVERDTAHTSLLGYSKIKIVKVDISSAQITDGLHFCGGGLDDWLLNALKGVLGSTLLGGFTDTINQTIADQLCLKTDPVNGCPNGSADSNGTCMYPDGACASMMLGLDGHMNLGAALSSISPGTTGGLDILFAVGGSSPRTDDPSQGWGDLNPIQQGATLGLFGGANPMPTSTCVKAVPLELPTGIPIPNELMGNALPGWVGDGPHVGFALSERFLNHAMKSAYNSGVLCLGVSTEQVAQLSTGLFSLLVPSIKFLTYQKSPTQIAIAIRPQQPPTITVGNGTDMVTDPLLRVKLDKAMIDFYAWSTDRFIRIFTAQFDLDVPVGIEVTATGQLQPKLDKIYVNNAVVTNSGLLKEKPEAIAGALADVITGMAGQFLGGLSPIDVSSALSSLGLTLNLQQNGLRKLSKNQDNFLGVFASFGVAVPTTSLEIDTFVDGWNKSTPADGFRLTTMSVENQPKVHFRVSSPSGYGSNEVEYAWKIDRGYWHPWTTSRDLVVDDPFLRMQGLHDIAIKARLVGQPATEDKTPAVTRVIVDVDAPQVRLGGSDGATTIEATDIVSPSDKLMVRWSFDQSAPTAWAPLLDVQSVAWADDAKSLLVDVRDEEGNVSSVSQSVIRGRPDASLAGQAAGCGCSVPGTTTSGTGLAGVASILGALGMVLRMRSRRRPFVARASGVVASASLLAIGGSFAGCNCGDSSNTTEPVPEADAAEPNLQCGEADNDPCAVLEPGLVGAYTSAAATKAGVIWVSGYNEADWDNGVNYGDLVVGQWDAATKKVKWTSVDGVPSTPEPDPLVTDIEKSWRGGQDAAGDDVGMWTSLKVDDSGNPRVAYFDMTNKALKFASYDGSKWTVSTAYKQADQEAGRYAKMLLIGGKPVVAFQVIEKGSAGFAVSRVKIAKAKSATPKAMGDWDFEDAVVDNETPCRANLCKTGQVCVQSTFQCAAKVTTCVPKCASGQACVADTCQAIFDTTKLDSYPDAIGDYISLAVGPQNALGLVYYNRIHGNLIQVRTEAGKWQDPVILDGQTTTTPPVDTGDVGIGASLLIDDKGDWHVTYANGFTEALQYMFIAGGKTPKAPEIVDDGTAVDTGAFDDGVHIVGDDSNITVTAAGELRVAYQDATSGTLRWTIGTAAGDTHTWVRKVVKQDGFAGYFPNQVTTNGATVLVNWWRKGGAKIEGDVNVASP